MKVKSANNITYKIEETEEDYYKNTTDTHERNETNTSKFAIAKEYNKNMSSNMSFIDHGQKKVTEFEKKIENILFLTKLEQKNKLQLEDIFERKMNKINASVAKNENELEATLKELNENETKIYDIQRRKLESFRNEVEKFENIHDEMQKRINEFSKTISNIEKSESLSYNQTFMIMEDYNSNNNEILRLSNRIKYLREVLLEIEKYFNLFNYNQYFFQ